MKNIIISILTVLCFVSCSGMNVYAEEIIQNDEEEVIVYSDGLIYNIFLSVSASGKSILLTAKTNGSETMKTIGLKSVVIQRSTDNSSWSDCYNIGDMLSSNSANFYASSKNLGTYPGGYYYRITCEHYAKESGLFGSSESISNASNSIWINP